MIEKKALVFLGKFFAIFIALYYALVSLDSTFLQQWLAENMANALRLPLEGNMLWVGNSAFQINESCTGLVSAILLTSTVFSVRKPAFRKKAAIWVVGLIVLFLANLVRLYAVLWAGIQWGVGAAEAFHVISWFLMSALILALWYCGVRYAEGKQAFGELL